MRLLHRKKKYRVRLSRYGTLIGEIEADSFEKAIALSLILIKENYDKLPLGKVKRAKYIVIEDIKSGETRKVENPFFDTSSLESKKDFSVETMLGMIEKALDLQARVYETLLTKGLDRALELQTKLIEKQFERSTKTKIFDYIRLLTSLTPSQPQKKKIEVRKE